MGVPRDVVTVASLVFTLGCAGDSTGPGDRLPAPQDRVPALGTYAYSARGSSWAVEGKLVLTSATPDSIAALFYAPRAKRQAPPGQWVGKSYMLDIGLVRHLIARRGSPTQVTCEAGVIRSYSYSSGLDIEPAQCSLTWESANTAPLVSAIGDWRGESSLGTLSFRLEVRGDSVSGDGFWTGKVGGGLGNPMSRRLTVGGIVDGANLTLTLLGGSAGNIQLTGTMTAESMEAQLAGNGFNNARITLSLIE